jgi:hypothetical protein
VAAGKPAAFSLLLAAHTFRLSAVGGDSHDDLLAEDCQAQAGGGVRMTDQLGWLIGIVVVLGSSIAYGIDQINNRLERIAQILIDIRDGRRY